MTSMGITEVQFQILVEYLEEAMAIGRRGTDVSPYTSLGMAHELMGRFDNARYDCGQIDNGQPGQDGVRLSTRLYSIYRSQVVSHDEARAAIADLRGLDYSRARNQAARDGWIMQTNHSVQVVKLPLDQTQ